MKTLFASLLIAFTLGTTSLSFATGTLSSTAKDVTPVEARVVVKPQSMKLDVAVGATEHSSVTIRLRNADGQMLVKKLVQKNDQGTLVRFDLAQLADGKYSIEISDGSSKLVKEFDLQTSVPVPASYRTISVQ